MAESESVEMYLKTILELEEAGGPVAIARVAERLGVSTVSVNEMLKRLIERGFVSRAPYRGVNFTPEGRLSAIAVVRRHRLWECFLVERLGISWEHSHDIACSLEHATGADVAERLAAYLGNPEVCPHGNAIPGPSAMSLELTGTALAELAPGTSGRILRVFPEEVGLLEYLTARDLRPGTLLRLLELSPFDNLLTIDVDGRTHIVGQTVANRVFVRQE